MKTCSACKVSKPLEAFPVRPEAPDGRRGVCCVCRNARVDRDSENARRRAAYAVNPEPILARNRQWVEEHSTQRLLSQAAYREANRDRINEQKRKHYRENRDRLVAIRRAYYAKHRDECMAASRRYYREHQEELLAYRRAYRATNRAVVLAGSYRTAAALAGVEPFVDLDETALVAIIAEYGGMCAYCKETEADSFDHVVPVSKGGPHTRENVVPACIPCNSSKNNKPVEEWFASR